MEPQIAEPRGPKTKTVEPTQVQTRQPRASRSDGSKTEAEINRVIDQIIHFNDAVAKTDDERWQISISLLKKLTARSQNIITRVVSKDRVAEIQQQHDKYGLHSRTVNRGKDVDVLRQALELK